MTIKSHTLIALAGLALGGAAQAQTVEVRVPDNAAALRAAMEASDQAAARGQRVGMLSGRLNPQAQRAPRGGITQELDASTMMYSVARIGADGKLEKQCVAGQDAAARAVSAPDFAKRLTPAAKETFDVK